MNPPARYGLDSKKHHFAGGSASEFSELSGEGEIYSPPQVRGLTYRPSREFANFWDCRFQRSDGFMLANCAGDQREFSKKLLFTV